MTTLMQHITDRLIAWRWMLLAMGVLAAAVAYLPSGQLDFDRSIENMFSPDDPLLVPYERLKRTFGGNEIVMAVYTDPELLNDDGRGIRRLAKISDRLERVEGVREVLSLDRPLGELIVTEESRMTRGFRKLLEGYTHGADGQTVAVVCMLKGEAEMTQPRLETIAALRAIVADLPDGLGPGKIAGEPVMVVDGFNYIEQDGSRLSWASTLLLALTIIVCFRSARWVIIPIAVVQLTVLLTKAMLVWSGLRLSMISSMLTAIVTVVGIATVIHIIVRFREARLSGLAPHEALRRAGVLLAAPIFWACSTDAVGFASLLVSDVGPVRDFGMMMAIGSLTVLVSVALLVPGLVLLGRFDSDPKRAWGEGLLDLQLAWLIRWVLRWPKTIGAAALLVAGVTSAGIYRLEVESDFTRNFRSSSPIVRSYQFVEQHLGGAGVWDVLLPAPERLNWKYLKRVKKLEQRLLDEANVLDGSHSGISKTLSLAGAMIDGGPVRLEGFRPVIIRAMVKTGLAGMEAKMPAFYHALHGEDPRQEGRYCMRIMLRCTERQPAHQKRMLIERVERICREEFAADDTTQGAEVTGFFVLLTSLIDSMLRDQWLAFAVATLGIGLMMVVALRSPIYAVVALVPNVVPIFVVLGLLGWLGLKMNMGAAMIAAVSMGLSIDSSIHYITAFRRALRENKSLHESLDAVHQTVGRAMVFSTLALIVGFSVLCTSQFVPTIYFGALVSMSMLGGLFGNLVVLPLLLKLVTREPVNPTPHHPV